MGKLADAFSRGQFALGGKGTNPFAGIDAPPASQVPVNRPAKPVKGTKKSAKKNPARNLPGRQKRVKP